MIEPAAPRIKGVLSPVVTPFKSDYSPDAPRFVRHCRWLVSNNVGLAVFGTNSEGNSLSVEERMVLLERLVEAGVDPARMMPGTGCCALSDSVRLSSHAVKLGCAVEYFPESEGAQVRFHSKVPFLCANSWRDTSTA